MDSEKTIAFNSLTKNVSFKRSKEKMIFYSLSNYLEQNKWSNIYNNTVSRNVSCRKSSSPFIYLTLKYKAY